jgi:DNA-binding IclR family transcriptional regulator
LLASTPSGSPKPEAEREAASTYLQTLARLGILREQKHGREKYYINEALFNELAS